jgi:hypothetical protein
MNKPPYKNNDLNKLSSHYTVPPSGRIAKASKQESHLDIAGEYYRNHQLTIKRSGTFCIGEVYKCAERVAYCEALDTENARQHCRRIIDESLFQEATKNQKKPPTVQDISRAFLAIQTQDLFLPKQLLLAHLEQNNQTIDSVELKTKAGFNSTTEVMLAYANFARLLCDALNYVPPQPDSGQDAYLSMAIETHKPDPNSAIGLSISLTPIIYSALQQLNIP